MGYFIADLRILLNHIRAELYSGPVLFPVNLIA